VVEGLAAGAAEAAGAGPIVPFSENSHKLFSVSMVAVEAKTGKYR
jgi:hypothetical protein